VQFFLDWQEFNFRLHEEDVKVTSRRVPALQRAVLLDEEHLFTNIACMKVRLLVNNLLTSHGLTGHSQEISHPPLLR